MERLAILLLGLAFCIEVISSDAIAQNHPDNPQRALTQYRPTSFVRILANPEFYHGLRVTITGYLHWRFEDAALYLSKTDADYLTSANAMWIQVIDSVRRRPVLQHGQSDTVHSMEYFDGKYVTMTGTFNKDKLGHLGSFSGTLDSVDVVTEIPRSYDGRKKLRQDKAKAVAFPD